MQVILDADGEVRHGLHVVMTTHYHITPPPSDFTSSSQIGCVPKCNIVESVDGSGKQTHFTRAAPPNMRNHHVAQVCMYMAYSGSGWPQATSNVFQRGVGLIIR